MSIFATKLKSYKPTQLRKTVSRKGINDDVPDREAEAMITEFILERKGSGQKTIKGPEISENLYLPADQVERILDRFVEKKKVSRV